MLHNIGENHAVLRILEAARWPGPDELEAGLEVFSRWEPPAGFEFKGIYARADGGGFCICEVTSAEVMFEATSPWSGVFLDYEMSPIVEIETAVELWGKASEFRKG